MAKISLKDIIEALKEFTLLELSDLVKAIEEEFNVSAAIPVASATSTTDDTKKEEPTEVNLILTNAGSQKIAVIKLIREITGLGLMEAKQHVDKAPSEIKKGILVGEAEELKKKFEDVGAVIEIK